MLRPQVDQYAPGVLFAVVIPAFNDREQIAPAVASVLAQDLLGVVVVVDDGSTDGTAEAARDLGEPRVRVVQQANGGPGAARNAGAAAAAGQATHLVFLDADDALLPGALAAFAAGHGVDNGTPLVRSVARVTELDGSERRWSAEPSPHRYPRGTPVPGTFSIDAALFAEIGGYDPEFWFGENSELLLRAQSSPAAAAAGTTYIDAVTLAKRTRDGRPSDFYAAHKLAAVDRMLSVHAEDLRDDPETRASHHAIASHLHRQAGRRRPSIQHAVLAARAQPAEARNWGRVARSVLPGGGPAA